jgi:hypothetical protein
MLFLFPKLGVRSAKAGNGFETGRTQIGALSRRQMVLAERMMPWVFAVP